jgi:hypothetical protein
MSENTGNPMEGVSDGASTTESNDVGNPAEVGEGGQQAKQPTDEILDKIARKYKVKLDGEELEVDEDELLRGYQLRKVSDKRLQEGVMARKQAEALLHMLKTDPRRVLSDPRIGIDVKKFAEDIIYQQIQDEMMTPEQRELAQYKRKVQEYEAQQKKIQDEQKLKEEQAVLAKHRDAYVSDISDALANAGLPKNDYTVQRVVHEMTKAIKAGFGNVKASDVIDLVHAQFIKDTKALYGSSSEETLIKLLGEDVASKIRNYDLEKFREKNKMPKSNNVKTNNVPKPKKDKGDKVLTPSQLRAKIEEEFGIG